MIFPSAPAGVEPAAEALPDADPDALPESPPHALSESTITPAATAERIRFAFFMFLPPLVDIRRAVSSGAAVVSWYPFFARFKRENFPNSCVLSSVSSAGAATPHNRTISPGRFRETLYRHGWRRAHKPRQPLRTSDGPSWKYIVQSPVFPALRAAHVQYR